MLSLAPFKYRNILERDGGPVRLLEASATARWTGEPCYAAAATLSDALRPERPRKLGIYDDADGGGMHASRNQACFIAVSEALERWAFYASHRGPDRTALAFDLDASTTGMAAFPGLTAAPARRNALLEAAERWSVLEWWRGRLPATPFSPGAADAEALELATPFADARVVIVWTGSPRFGGRTYGFAAAPTRDAAVTRAGVELTRNLNALGRFYERSGSTPATVDLAAVADRLERRLVYFSTPAGVGSFDARAEASRALKDRPSPPSPAADREVTGPWSRYARVWRVLYPHAGGADDDSETGVFAF